MIRTRPGTLAGMWARKLPWIDGVAALLAGVVVLALRGVLTDFYAIPRDMLTFVGVVNVAYSSVGLSLGARTRRPAWHLWLLIGANVAWAIVCIVLVARLGGGASIFGNAHLVGEALFVLVLAVLEWRCRSVILGPLP